jgi:hypothetical protein
VNEIDGRLDEQSDVGLVFFEGGSLAVGRAERRKI